MLFDSRTIDGNQARMESARAGFDALSGEVARMILPDGADFGGTQLSQGQSNTQYQYDEYGALALQDGVSVFEGLIMPQGQMWQKIAVSDDAVMADIECASWLEAKTKRLFELRNDPKSGFIGAMHASAESLLSLHGQSLWVDIRRDETGWACGLSYQSEEISGLWVERDAAGNVYRIHRKFSLTAEQAFDKWGEASPPKVRDAMAERPGKEPRRADIFEFIHVIERNARLDPKRADAPGKPWIACYYSISDKLSFSEGGYRTLRRIFSCFSRRTREDYGRSPAMRILPALRASQILMQSRVLGAEQKAKPPLLAPSDELDRATIDLGPWGMTYGGLDDRGEPMLKTFLEAVDMTDARDIHAEVRQVIDRSWWRDLLQIFKEQKTHISALRTSEEMAEKGLLLAPLGRQQTEWLAPMLDVELDLMHELGEFDDMPQRLVEYFGASRKVRAIYDNLLSQMLEAAEAAGLLRALQMYAEIAQLDPQSAVEQLLREMPMAKMIPFLLHANGVPARLRATDAEKAAFDQQQAQKAMVQQLTEAAPALGVAAKNFAQAGAIGAGAPAGA
jgi:hypothetical protein